MSSVKVDINWLKQIDDKIKCVIFGYIRNVQNILPSNKPFYNIPQLISYIILLYFYEYECFEIAGKDIKISSNGKIITKKSTFNLNLKNTTFGEYIIEWKNNNDNIIYEWKIKLNKIHRWDVIGFASNHTQNDNDYMSSKINPFYCIFMGGFKLRLNKILEYSDVFKSGDIIKINFNLIQKKLIFYKDTISNGIVFKNIQCNDGIKYKLAICLSKNESEIELIDFKVLYPCI